MRVSDLKIGSSARIKTIQSAQSAYRKRLIAMGLVPGTVLQVTRMAPLGDPIEIKVRGATISLRKDEANIMIIEDVAL